ncbi:MAG: hypothetical protein AAB490_06630 [Patescibacteria group bacterium]|mgnify:CR=1 FL=1
MGIHASMERAVRREEEYAARSELIKQFNDWAADFTSGAELPIAWFLPYKDKQLREAWEQGDDARREFVLQLFRASGKIAPYELVRDSDQPARDRYETD